MKKLSKFHLFLNLIAGLSFALNLAAQENPVKSLEPQIQERRLVAAGHFKGLLDDALRETLASGISHTLNFQIILHSPDKKGLPRIQETILLRYNVWEKVYLLRSTRITKFFTDIQGLENFLNDSLFFDIAPKKSVPFDIPLQFILYYTPASMSESQKNKLDSWIFAESEIKESQPAREPEGGFSINLSSLIAMFFKKKTEDQVYVFRSVPFTLEQIKHDENVTQ